jgi:hypothetical protein
MIYISKCNKRFEIKVGDPVKVGRCPLGDSSGVNVEFLVGVVSGISKNEDFVDIVIPKTEIELRFYRSKENASVFSHFEGLKSDDGYYYGIDAETNISWSLI